MFYFCTVHTKLFNNINPANVLHVLSLKGETLSQKHLLDQYVGRFGQLVSKTPQEN